MHKVLALLCRRRGKRCGAVVVGMDGRGALGKGFAWSTGEREILGHCVQLREGSHPTFSFIPLKINIALSPKKLIYFFFHPF